jgi:hypothetical protein
MSHATFHSEKRARGLSEKILTRKEVKNMHCETRSHHGRGRHHCDCGQGHHRGSCGCGCGGGFGRRFLTKEEKIAGLQEYLESLQKEAQAVEERIAALNKEA